MADHAISDHPAVQQQLDRLMALGPGADILGLDRITRLLDRLGNPHDALPPVFHVAGTNGKGSTCAFLRAALEADGKRVHVFTSPHLVRFNERIRIAGSLISDDALAALLGEVLDRGGDIGASFFEVTAAAAFLAFSREPADACVIEVGLGGRLDATNMVADPAACAIAQLGLDHQAFLGDTIGAIAAEKAGIARAGRPLVTLSYPAEAAQAVARIAEERGADLRARQRDWDLERTETGITLTDPLGSISLAAPILPGAHQAFNLALAIATIRAQDRVSVSDKALLAAPIAATWPARMQRLLPGPLTDLLGDGCELWLDGGHNPAAGEAISTAIAERAAGRPVHLVCGMLSNKDMAGLLAPFASFTESLTAIPVPGHAHHAPETLADAARTLGIAETRTAADPASALSAIRRSGVESGVILILGSLYLAGEVLAANGEFPD
ncbi:bifunctional folylpolyglutamate synthase/dihydrofolate synthase [Stakelama pacifica]|uniref:Dihydrofolate synthase/folylpolyglutamate synthase n=1 Tax=Stakelama pacifica TaxID=517720 RepID=A0A4R6FAA7_9SPHN|nr:folylpolyglutamate synthase/dihydrofolate synthase family protein [Stakelama pacifica]TDN77907.1 dihydrofolate synthase/folylpolyglutamate synthase [Stakelama pacifica]GGP00588.1 bifunctional folylpolyglutamate synthase/dihydrofolate synthase [Stakelama pacifica]